MHVHKEFVTTIIIIIITSADPLLLALKLVMLKMPRLGND
jgi:hypothetical protein